MGLQTFEDLVISLKFIIITIGNCSGGFTVHWDERSGNGVDAQHETLRVVEPVEHTGRGGFREEGSA